MQGQGDLSDLAPTSARGAGMTEATEEHRGEGPRLTHSAGQARVRTSEPPHHLMHAWDAALGAVPVAAMAVCADTTLALVSEGNSTEQEDVLTG